MRLPCRSIAILLLTSVFLAGCPTLTPTQYYRLDLELDINGKPYSVKYNWSCREVLDGPNFGPGWILTAKWRVSPKIFAVVRRIENDAVFLVHPPGSYCDYDDSGSPHTKGRYPPITIVDSVSNPTLVQVFTRETTNGIGYKIKYRSVDIRRLEKAEPDYVETEEDKRIRPLLLGEKSPGFQSVSARITPESVWAKSKPLTDYFQGADGVLIAKQSGRHVFFPVQQRLYDQKDYDLDAHSIPLTKTNNVWQLPQTDDFSLAEIFIRVQSTDTGGKEHHGIGYPPSANVEYGGSRTEVLNSQQIFDSKERLLIQFVNRYLPFQMIGEKYWW